VTKDELWKRIGRLSCCVTGSTNISFHHCQGGSMAKALAARGLDGTKGIGLRGYSDALVIPIHPELHYVGPAAVDGSVGRSTWELKWGTQESHLDAVSEQLGFDLWRLHAEWTNQIDSYRPKTPSRKP